MEIPPEQLEVCLNVLQQISEDPMIISGNERMKSLITKIHREGKRYERRAQQQSDQIEARQLSTQTAIVESQRSHRPLASLSEGVPCVSKPLSKPARCYICKENYTELHFFYHMLCPTCATFNYQKRQQRIDLKGRVALVTGGRIKIGYQVALRLLRDGAKVIVTSRFPRDTALRFNAESDFSHWRERLHIYGVDFRNPSAIEEFISHLLCTENWLDIIVNNAAQTIKRPLSFYQAILSQEQLSWNTLSEGRRTLLLENFSETTRLQENHPEGQLTALQLEHPERILDADGQPLDVRSSNSWSLKLEEVSGVEMLEVQLINAVAPFMFNSQLKPLLLQSPFAHRFIVNVSAMEGQFNRASKTINHPHTNMAKAALNMMTRTSAAGYATDRIFMNSVDTGWITDENPFEKKVHLQESNGFYTPLDVIDGAARIYDPIVQGIEEFAEPLYGHFLKDYCPCPW